MTLTFGPAPLGSNPSGHFNFSLDDAPRHRILFEGFPRRMRAFVGDRHVLDSTRGMLLHESNIKPVYYAPIEDFAEDVLVASDHTTHCPFKGDASYWSLKVGDREIENAVWHYPEPVAESPWLEGLRGAVLGQGRPLAAGGRAGARVLPRPLPPGRRHGELTPGEGAREGRGGRRERPAQAGVRDRAAASPLPAARGHPARDPGAVGDRGPGARTRARPPTGTCARPRGWPRTRPGATRRRCPRPARPSGT